LWPHTSNWDFVIGLAIIFVVRLDIRWIGKKEIFWGPMNRIFRWLGGIPADRKASTNLVEQVVKIINKEQTFRLALSPEGTRKKVEKWRSGFYHIAVGAKIPIVLSYLDYSRKVGGFEKVFYPTGNYDVDLIELQKFYRGIKGKNR
jgi:1-acyl-sn-glycerol-3-phosphate acyltransferase